MAAAESKDAAVPAREARGRRRARAGGVRSAESIRCSSHPGTGFLRETDAVDRLKRQTNQAAIAALPEGFHGTAEESSC